MQKCEFEDCESAHDKLADEDEEEEIVFDASSSCILSLASPLLISERSVPPKLFQELKGGD
jgi:hypothetical protein